MSMIVILWVNKIISVPTYGTLTKVGNGNTITANTLSLILIILSIPLTQILKMMILLLLKFMMELSLVQPLIQWIYR